MDPGGEIVPFDPTDNDVVSTKLRSWNLGHPGNLEYAELLEEYARKMPTPGSPNYSTLQNQFAARIVEIVTKERGGRFLKIEEGQSYPSFCHVMDHRACMHKVFHGVKNKHAVIMKKGNPGKPTKEQSLKQQARLRELKALPRDDTLVAPKPVQPKAPLPKKRRRARSETPRQRHSEPPPTFIRRRRKRRRRNEITGELEDRESPPSSKKKTPVVASTPITPVSPRSSSKQQQAVIRYQAQQGEDGKINPYALELISYVCNHEADKPHAILEDPVSTYADSTDGEPDKERRIRLQLRHRLFAAKAIQMPVVDFARKILEIWGGTLSEVEEQPVAPAAAMPSRHSTRKRAMGEQTPNSEDRAVPHVQATSRATNDNNDTNINDVTMAAAGSGTQPENGNHGGVDGNDSADDSSTEQRTMPGKAVSRGIPQKEPRRATASLLDTANVGNDNDMDDDEQGNGIASALWRSDGNNDDDDDGGGSENAADDSDANSGEEESEHSDESEEEDQEDGESEAGYGTANEQLSGEDSGSDENFEEEERSVDEDDEGGEENERAGDMLGGENIESN